MPDNPLNDIALQKILERLDTLDQKFTGEIRQLDQKFTGEIQSVRGEVQSVGKRVEQLDEKFTGEIRHLDQKVQGVHHELLDFRRASGETWGHILRIVEQSQKSASINEELARKQRQQDHQATLEIWDGVKRWIAKDEPRLIATETAVARLQKELEGLTVIIKEMQKKIASLESRPSLTA